MFERHTSRYLPFDHEATALLLELHRRPLGAVLTERDPESQAAVVAFFECFEQRGFFTLDGTLAADVLPVNVPPDHLVGPLALHLEVIGACNLACSHCFAGTLPRNNEPLSLVEMDDLFADLAAMGSFRLGLTGGEPLLRKDLFDILDSATAHGLHPCLTTNALLLTEDIARGLGRRPLVWLNVSLEGPDAATNDAIRGAGTFDAVLEKLALLRRHARFTLAFTVMSHNAHMGRRCAELAYQVGAHTAVFRPLYPAGVALHHLDLLPTFHQYSAALDDLAHMDTPGADLRSLDPFGPQTRTASQARIHTSHACGAGMHVCSVSVQGDVSPCSFLGEGFHSGNLRQTRFPEIWRHGHQFRRLRGEGEQDHFAGGCRARAQVLAGSAFAPDPWFEAHQAGHGPHPGGNVEVDTGRVPLPMC